MDKHFDPQTVEGMWYDFWEKTGRFRGDSSKGGEPYCIVIPPPNVTGILHMGHALNVTIQDVLVRWHRMQGRNVLWIPGTDHAGIATQNVVEKALRKEGKRRQDLGREKFIERVWEWRKKYGGTIVNQLRKLGSSCDWSRERFTMDEGLSRAVSEVFCRMYDENLVYRGNYIVNWCPRCGTALADDESEHEPNDGSLWHIRYPVVGHPGEYVQVATTRPETLPGDTAVAVNPGDARYAGLHGKSVILPLSGREIPVVQDDYVERDFGTGVVKITPAHDPNDFAVAQRHNLPMINIMNDDGTMNEASGYNGLDRFECRKKIVEDLDKAGYLVKVEPYKNSVGHCYRCGTIVESRLSRQWFVRMKPLASAAIEAVRSGETVFTPKRCENTYFNWMENIRDWCISRQIWWGHRIPVYTCGKCGKEFASPQKPERCPECGADSITQDPDVLDTWFSSWLWPFSTLGWPDKDNRDLKFYYPTSDLVTAPDIIFFWVARMIMAGCKFMGKTPFKNVVIHGVVRDDRGRKMSKSLGNSIDPLNIVEKYGADSLRFSMMQITSPGIDLHITEDKFEIGRNFATKIWNAARFMKMHADKCPDIDWMRLGCEEPDLDSNLLEDDDRHIITACSRMICSVTSSLEKYRFQDAALALYDFFWSKFCDRYLEFAKPALYGDNDAARKHRLCVMGSVLGKALRVLHPFMPFVTEELWHQMGYTGRDGSIMTAEWPKPLSKKTASAYGLTDEIYDYVENRHELVTAARAIRADSGIPSSEPAVYVVRAINKTASEFLNRDAAIIKNALKAKSLHIAADADVRGMQSVTCKLGLIGVEAEKPVDSAEEKAKIEAEIEKLKGFLKTVNSKLANETFIAKAPAAIVEQQRAKRAELETKISERQAIVESFMK